MRILFVDDDASSVQPAIDALTGHSCAVSDFDSVEAQITVFIPDLVVLDMMGSMEDGEGEHGNRSYKNIWEKQFCPIIIYSANPDLSSSADHPLVVKIQKGSNSELKISEQVKVFADGIVLGVDKIKKEINSLLQITLRDVVPHAYSNAEISDKNQTVLHMARRRIAAHLDEGCGGCGTLMPWEQYIVPPLTKSLLFGDILRKKGANITDPASYVVVLTPSCDLDSGAGRKPAEKLLYAECCAVDVLFSKAQVKKDPETLKKMVLTQGFHREYYCVPEFKGVIPPMLVNLKELSFIETKKIGPDGELVRIASIDSPFREQLAWAYLNTACRPGVPDRDVEKWAKQYLPPAGNA